MGSEDDTSTADDERLRRRLAELAAGRLEALDEIWRLCADDLYGLALWRTRSAADAEDAVQEVFVRLARRGSGLTRVRRPRSYLLRMARNAAVDIAGRRREVPLPEELPHLVTADGLQARVDAARVSALLAGLPAGQREVVFLHDLAGLSFREVAEVCGIPLFTAASRHRLAIRRLRRLLGVEP